MDEATGFFTKVLPCNLSKPICFLKTVGNARFFFTLLQKTKQFIENWGAVYGISVLCSVHRKTCDELLALL